MASLESMFMHSVSRVSVLGLGGLQLLAVATLGPILILFLWHVIEYFRDPLRLRHVPSPPTAGFSSAWIMYYCWQKTRTIQIHNEHQRLGEIVRIQPNHVSFSNGDAIEDIHGHGKDLMKAPFYDTLVAPTGDRSMFDSNDRVVHGQKRKYVAHLFSPKNVTDLEQVVANTTNNLLTVLDRFADAKNPAYVDLLPWIRLYALDIISDVAFAEKAGCLATGSDIMEAETPAGKTYKMSAIRGIYDGGAYNVFWGQAPSWMWLTKELTKWTEGRYYADGFYNIAVKAVKRRVPKEDVVEYERRARLDLFHRLLVDRKGDPLNLEMNELIAEAAVLMVAGSDTSGTGLISTLIFLALNPDKLAKLQKELDAAIPPNTTVATHEQVSHLPYLRACVDEAVRLRPPNAYGLPRIVSDKGATIQGHYYKPGTIVSISTLSVHRRHDYFPDADSFNPDRWLDKADERQQHNLKKYVIPFSFGSRACVGRNLAFMELLVSIGSIIHRYDLELKERREPTMIERFNTNPADFVVKLKRRTPVAA
ncbi:hypothetical protein MMC08_004514 [Hypocenomyce scalaris]|nr:hypothetical protein [Hypocenomyce scalaris]